MLTKKMTGIVGALAVAAIAIVVTLAVTGTFSSGPKDREFSAPMQGSFAAKLETCAPAGIDLQCTFELHGEGTALLMDDFVDNSTWKIQFDSVIEDPTSTKGSILSGSGVLTAANGDTVNIEVVAGGRLDDGSMNAPFKIMGGTGKFANASGTIYRKGVFSVTDPEKFVGEFNVSYEGTINY